jgi:hypothetical protein
MATTRARTLAEIRSAHELANPPKPKAGSQRGRPREKFVTKRDPRFASAPSWTFGGRFSDELSTLASNRPQYCKTGTHRAEFGELLLDHLARRNDTNQAALERVGRHWKAKPGPGAYRTPFYMGRGLDDMVKVDEVMANQFSEWTIEKFNRKRTYQITGGYHPTTWEHEGLLKYPSIRNITPGPGAYFQDSGAGLSIFNDYSRPQIRNEKFQELGTGALQPVGLSGTDYLPTAPKKLAGSVSSPLLPSKHSYNTAPATMKVKV